MSYRSTRPVQCHAFSLFFSLQERPLVSHGSRRFVFDSDLILCRTMETTGGEGGHCWHGYMVIPPWQEEENVGKRLSTIVLKYGTNFSPATRGTFVAALHLNYLPLVGHSDSGYGFVFTPPRLDRGPSLSVEATIAGSVCESVNHFTISLSLSVCLSSTHSLINFLCVFFFFCHRCVLSLCK